MAFAFLFAGKGSTFTVNGAFTQSAPGTLAGSGTFAATPLSLDGTVSPGAGTPETLTIVGSTVFKSTLTLALRLGSPNGTNDHLVISGNFTLSGTLDITALPGFEAGVYDIIDYSGGTFTDNTLAMGTAPDGFNYQIETNTPGQVDLSVTNVPEPSTWAMLAGGFGSLLAFRRRR